MPTKKYITCRDIKDKKYKVVIKDLSFRASVYGLLFKGDQILLSRQGGDGYDFPGGGIDKGETIYEALQREFWEETGLKVKPGKLIGVFEDFFIGIEKKTPYHSILMYYLCSAPKGRITTKNFTAFEKTYIDKAEWIKLKDVTKLKFYNPIDSPKLIKQALGKL